MRLRFSYTVNGERKFFEIKPRETGVTLALENVGAHYDMRTYGDKEYIAPDTWHGSGYFSLTAYSNQIQPLISRAQAVNALVLSENNQFYDHSVPIADLSKNDGQLLHYDGSAGTAELCAFVRTEYPVGEPVSKFYLGGLFLATPTGTNPIFCAVGSTVYGTYTTETPPLIDFALINVTYDGVTYPCMLVSCIGNQDSPVSTQTYLYDLRLFDGTAPQPTTDSNTTTPYGRTGTYNFTSDKMTDVSPSGYSLINRWEHGLTLYHLNDLQVNAIFAEMWGNETLWQMFLNSTIKQIQGILCLHKMPVPIASGASTRPLSIFGKRVARGELLEQLPLINEQLIKYPSSPQWIPIEEIYGDYFDFAGQSKLSVYLPFIGCVPLDVNQIMGGAVMTVYYFDLLTGNCIARVYGRNSMGNGAEVLLYQGSGNAALHVPYVGNDQGGMKLLGALAGVGTAGLATLATGGVASAPAMAAVTGAAQTIFAPHNASVNNIPTECSPLSYPYVCYIQEYPERLLTALQGIQTGFAAASGAAGTTVNDYRGYVQGYLHADIDGLTDAEKAEIERMFEEGVII